MSVATDSLEVTEVAEHSLLPVPDRARTSTAAHQFWIWTGANIAPINWVLGALGIRLGLSLFQTVAYIGLRPARSPIRATAPTLAAGTLPERV